MTTDVNVELTMPNHFKFGLVAGEVSSDLLASKLIQELQQLSQHNVFAGVTGIRMQELGCTSLANIEELSLLGLLEPIIHLPRLFKLQRHLIHSFEKWPADCVIGVDSGDFNIPLLEKLRQKGIPTFQFVSPQVFAWRHKRVHRIKRAVDGVFCLFPFDVEFYQQYDLNAYFVGHPLADEIPLEPNTEAARSHLNIAEEDLVATMLPGSRTSTFKRLAPLFLKTAVLLSRDLPQLQWNVALVNEHLKPLFEEYHRALAPNVSIRVIVDDVRHAVSSANVVLTTSGTATLETMLLKKPMIIANRISAIGFSLAKRLIKIPHIGLPNLLAKERIVPEWVQSEATPNNLSQALLELIQSPEAQQKQVTRFYELHQQLRLNATARTAAIIWEKLNA